MGKPRLLLLSNSTLHGEEYLGWCCDIIKAFFAKSNAIKILFIPYAVRDHDNYAKKAEARFKKMGLELESIHQKSEPIKAVEECEGIFIGGGNTFLLLKTLYDKKLIEPIKQNVLVRGIPYMGASAGTNVATTSICTTNDMPICYPPSFEALKLVPFNINPHYIDSDPNSKHMGETRETRIKEYLEDSNSPPVLALREGSLLLVEDGKATLCGISSAKVFEREKPITSYNPGADMSFLLEI